MKHKRCSLPDAELLDAQAHIVIDAAHVLDAAAGAAAAAVGLHGSWEQVAWLKGPVAVAGEAARIPTKKSKLTQFDDQQSTNEEPVKAIHPAKSFFFILSKGTARSPRMRQYILLGISCNASAKKSFL